MAGARSPPVHREALELLIAVGTGPAIDELLTMPAVSAHVLALLRLCLERTPRREFGQLLDFLFQPIDFLAQDIRLGIIADRQPVFESL